MHTITTEEGIIKEAFPKITDSTYIKRLLSVMNKPDRNRLEAALQFLLEYSEHPEKLPPYVTPFEVMSGPGIIYTKYHQEARLSLLSSFNRIPQSIIEKSFQKNRHLYLLTYHELRQSVLDRTYCMYEGTKFPLDSQERNIPSVVTDLHLQSDIAKTQTPDILQKWMDEMKHQTHPDEVYPPLPEEPSFLFSVPYGTVKAACLNCHKVFPVADLAECHNGHPLCRSCFTAQAKANILHCKICGPHVTYTHAILSEFLPIEQKHMKSPLHTPRTCACDFPTDTVKSGVCPTCFFPLFPSDKAHVWKCQYHGEFYLI